MKQEASRSLGKFLLAGAIGFVVDAAVLTLLVVDFRWSNVAARSISFPVALTVTWIINRRWAFSTSRLSSSLGEWIAYAVIQFMGAALNYGVFVLCVSLHRFPPALVVIPLAIGAFLGAGFNFLLLRRFVYDR